MTGNQRITIVEQHQHLPDNREPMAERPVRRAVPRWREWTLEHQHERTAYSDLSGYIKADAA